MKLIEAGGPGPSQNRSHGLTLARMVSYGTLPWNKVDSMSLIDSEAWRLVLALGAVGAMNYRKRGGGFEERSDQPENTRAVHSV